MSADADHLNKNGDNLQNVANTIREQYPEIFEKILTKMKQRVPGIGDIRSEITQDKRLLLQFKDRTFKDPFIDKYVSDGTYGTSRNVVSGNGTKYGWSERLFVDPFSRFFIK